MSINENMVLSSYPALLTHQRASQSNIFSSHLQQLQLQKESGILIICTCVLGSQMDSHVGSRNIEDLFVLIRLEPLRTVSLPGCGLSMRVFLVMT